MAARAPQTPPADRFDDLPVISIFRKHDRQEQFNQILREHDAGYFFESAGLVDEILTDPRIAGVTEQRIAGLLAAPLEFKPSDTRAKAKRLSVLLGGVDGEGGKWREIMPQETQTQLMIWAIFLGVAVAQIKVRKILRPKREAMPYLKVWHPQFLRWDRMLRTFVLRTARGEVVLPRPDAQPRGDGQWMVICPFGVQYGWTRGLIRSIGLSYLSRTWNERDWDRYIERQGMAILKGKVPVSAEEEHKTQFFQQLNNIGSEGAVLCPQGVDATKSYDVEKLEFEARTYEAMKERKEALDTDIAIRLLGQNLTTEVQGGSRAAAQTHNLVRLDKAKYDSEIGGIFRNQLLTWWADWNVGDPDLAPLPTYTVEPPDDENAEATALKSLGDAAQSLKTADPQVDVAAIMEEHGVPRLSDAEFESQQDDAEEAGPSPTAGGGPAAPDQGNDGGPASPPAGSNGVKQAQLSVADGVPVMRRIAFQGMPIAIEHPAGSLRTFSGDNGVGVAHSVQMKHDYGFIEGYLSNDGEALDCYIGPDETSAHVHVVHQLKAPEFRGPDEDKVMLGFASADEAKAAYLAHRNDDRAFGGMSVIPLDRFKAKLRRRAPTSTAKITASMLVELARGPRAIRASAAGAKRRARYHDRLVDGGLRSAAKALAPFLANVQAEIARGDTLADIRRRVLAAYKHSGDPKKLAEVITHMNALANIAGQHDVRAI